MIAGHTAPIPSYALAKRDLDSSRTFDERCTDEIRLLLGEPERDLLVFDRT